jgi:hypothetical protein
MKTLIAAAIVTTTISIANSASAIEITLWPVDPPTLFVDGTFVAGDYAKFVRATTGLPPGTAINLNSIGGDVREVIPIGEMIRARKFTTVCRSALHLGLRLRLARRRRAHRARRLTHRLSRRLDKGDRPSLCRRKCHP